MKINKQDLENHFNLFLKIAALDENEDIIVKAGDFTKLIQLLLMHVRRPVLTDKQQNIYIAIVNKHITATDYSYESLAKELGYKNKSNIFVHLIALEKKGFLQRTPNGIILS